MSFLAGELVTAARLLNNSDYTALTDTDIVDTTINTWTDFGTETITFSDPGVEVVVEGHLMSSCYTNDATADRVVTRVAISFDGGSTFDTSAGLAYCSSSTSAGGVTRSPTPATHVRQGTPTGSVVIKGQCMHEVSGGDAQFFSGFLTATIKAV